MIKKNKKMIIVTSILTLLPMIMGILLWDKLPDTMAIHFGMNGVANGWSNKVFTVIGMPIFMLCIHLLCVFITAADPKNKNISHKIYTLILWIVPLASIVCCVSIYGYALGINMSVDILANGVMGLLFIVLGNYLPKSRQNYTVGIKLPWTLADEENWNKTHRLAGWLWILCGIGFWANIFIQASWFIMIVIIIAVGIPFVYSLALYLKKKQSKDV